MLLSHTVRGEHSSRLKLSLAQPDPEEDDGGEEQKKRPSATAADPNGKAQQHPQQQPSQQHCPHIVSFYDVFSDPARGTVRSEAK